MSSPPLEMAVGLKKGHKVTKNAMKPKPSRRKGVCNKIVCNPWFEKCVKLNFMSCRFATNELNLYVT